jgi:hypothetical protein
LANRRSVDGGGGSGNDRGLLLAFLFAAAANALVYVLIGALVAFVKDKFVALKK